MPKSAKKSATVPFVTPWFTARYPKITQPDTKGKFADGKYKTDGLLDDENYAVVEKALKAAAKKLHPDVDVDDVQLPLKEFFANKEDKEKGEAEGRGITLKSQYKPAIFDTKKKRLPDNVKIGGGSIMRVDAPIFAWSKPTKMQVLENGKKKMVETTEYGVGLRLGDIQIKELVEFSGGGDGSAFDDVEEGGFEYDGEGDDNARADKFDDASDL